MRLATTRRALLLAALTVFGGASARAEITGRLVRVGLAGGAAQIVREGNWSFADVELATTGAEVFSGILEATQRDLDGDVVRYQATVALAPDAPARLARIYFVPSFRGSGDTISVRLLDAQSGRVTPITDAAGTAHDLLVSDPVRLLSLETTVVLDLSSPSIRLLAFAPDPQRDSAAQANFQAVPMDPRGLPDRWQGLEPVDMIVWDEPDPDQLSPSQIDALTNWVRHGGRLVLAAARNWQRIHESPLAELLPVHLTGVAQVREAQEFSEKILNDTTFSLAAYYRRHPLTRCVMTPLPGSAAVPADPQRLMGLDPLVYRRSVGAGTVTFVGAALHELLAPVVLPSDEGRPFAENEVDPQQAVRDVALAARRALIEKVCGAPMKPPLGDPTLQDVDLFAYVRASIGFQTVGLVYLLTAVLFALAYAVSATVGSYWWLKRRDLLQHAWTAFTVAAVAASVIGTLAVWGLRGVRLQLEQTSVVDAAANSALAVGTSLFGLKAPSHATLDLRLPIHGADGGDDDESHGPLRSMPETRLNLVGDETFTAPLTYTCASGGSALGDVPLRATLKELEGFWEGALDGRLEAELHMARFELADGRGRVDRFIEGSFIRNRLGFDLHDCYLLETAEDAVTRLADVRCYALGALPARGAGSDIDQTAFAAFFTKPKDARDAKAGTVERTTGELPQLADAMRGWVKPFLPLLGGGETVPSGPRHGNAVSALLMLSTISVYDPRDIHPQRSLNVLSTHARRYACLHQMTRQTALLIGFADADPPPALRVDGRRVRPNRALTMYRFLIPVVRHERT